MVEESMEQRRHTLWLIIEDTFIVLGPSILGLIGVLWFFWDELPDWGW